jgi:hypothetical protein
MKRRIYSCFFTVALLVMVLSPIGAVAANRVAADANPVAGIMVGPYSIDWLPKVNVEGIQLTVAGPGNFYWTRAFPKGARPCFAIADIQGQCLDGQYNYELKVLPQFKPQARLQNDSFPKLVSVPALTQAGVFRIRGGSFLSMSLSEKPGPSFATYNEDLYVIGSLCVGTDCSDPETWEYDVLRLKENNLRLHFDDTSSTSAFPANDWRILINDTADGGANYFAVEDTTAATKVFTIEAGAPANSLYIEDYGRIGLKTSVPAVELHIVDGDSPAVRLEQDTSSGWTAHVWDIVGNESNFFIRDVTDASKLPFRIQPGTPSSTLTLKSDGKVGIGTWTPAYKVQVETTGENSSVVVKRTDGVTNYINATDAYGNFGTVNNFPTRIMVNGTWRARFNVDNSLSMVNNASCTAGGVWTNASSIALKENLTPLSAQKAASALRELKPMEFNYKVDKSDKYVGFIAEEVPELVASKDRRGLSPMDIVAVLTKVVQEQQKTIVELNRRLENLEKKGRE